VGNEFVDRFGGRVFGEIGDKTFGGTGDAIGATRFRAEAGARVADRAGMSTA